MKISHTYTSLSPGRSCPSPRAPDAARRSWRWAMGALADSFMQACACGSHAASAAIIKETR